MNAELWAREGNLIAIGVTAIVFDAQRHLIVQPYSIHNLHRAAQQLGIKRCWFHRDHYDIPKRMITTFEPEGFFVKVSPRKILSIIKGACR